MLPRILWILVLSFLSSIEASSPLEFHAVRFSNTTSSSGLPSTLSTLLRSSPSITVPRPTRTAAVTSGTSSNITHNSTTHPRTPLTSKSRTSIASRSPGLPTHSSGNGTLPTTTAAPCCFVIQDTVSENWWQRTSYSSVNSVVDLTSYTTYITNLPNITATRVETNIYPTNASFSFTIMVGKNPITNLINSAPTPSELAQVLNATQVLTGGMTMQSPQAFYVYNTVRIITAEPVTDARGNVYCATMSTGNHGDVFPRVNEYAEAYFGGHGIAGATKIPTQTVTTTTTKIIQFTGPTPSDAFETFTATNELYSTGYTNSAGDIVRLTSKPSGVVISLVTPFIYAPTRGSRTPEYRDNCLQDSNTEEYGYVPHTLIDFLAQDPHYSAQYPGIESCYGGGPSIIQERYCQLNFESTTYQTAGGDLTSSTTIYVGTPVIHQDSTTVLPRPTGDSNDGAPISSLPTADGPPMTVPPPGKPSTSWYTVPPRVTTLLDNSGQASLGAIINSLVGNTESPSPPETPITIQAATTIPMSQAPPGAVGKSSNIDGTDVIIIPGPTTIPQQSPAIVIPATTTVPLSQAPPGAVGTTSTISGTPVLIIGPTTIPPPQLTPQPITIEAATTIPLSRAPLGAVGTTTTIDGTPFLIIPAPTTISPAPTVIFPTSTISGNPYLLIPPTTIPLSLAPTGLSGSTTTINGTPFLIVPSSTSLPLPPGFLTTAISGTPYYILPGPTSIPLSLAPYNLAGSTTTINGTPYLVIGAATTLPIVKGGITTIGGTTELVITGLTTMPVNSLFPISGKTTVISGTTMVVVSSATTVVEVSLGSLKSTSTSSVGGSQIGKSQATSTSKAGAVPTAGCKRGFLLSALGAVAGGVVMAVL